MSVAQPKRYIRPADSTDTPYGLCECGCGQATNIARVSYARLGWVKGEPIRFIHGHATRGCRVEPRKCLIEDCAALTRGQLGLCNEHYKQRTTAPPKRYCSVDDCERTHYAHGMCRLHYRRERRANDPEFRERERERDNDQRRKRLTDPDYRDRQREYERKRTLGRRLNPEYRAWERDQQRERNRKQRADPAYRERYERYRERARERARIRYATDSDFRANMIAQKALDRGFQRAMGL